MGYISNALITYEETDIDTLVLLGELINRQIGHICDCIEYHGLPYVREALSYGLVEINEWDNLDPTALGEFVYLHYRQELMEQRGY